MVKRKTVFYLFTIYDSRFTIYDLRNRCCNVDAIDNPARGNLMIKAVIFDVDGTLVDSVDLHAQAWKEALKSVVDKNKQK